MSGRQTDAARLLLRAVRAVSRSHDGYDGGVYRRASRTRAALGLGTARKTCIPSRARARIDPHLFAVRRAHVMGFVGVYYTIHLSEKTYSAGQKTGLEYPLEEPP